jgi:hypothetical protein
VTVFFFLFLPAIALYFLPSILAYNKSNFGGVLLLNLFLGWTLIGWIVALIWALSGDPQRVVVVHQAAGYGGGNFCPRCGWAQAGRARFCSNCGSAI